MDAVERELDSLTKTNTWTVVNAPTESKPIYCKWIFKIKRDSNGNVSKYKARLVAKGCAQKRGLITIKRTHQSEDSLP